MITTAVLLARMFLPASAYLSKKDMLEAVELYLDICELPTHGIADGLGLRSQHSN